VCRSGKPGAAARCGRLCQYSRLGLRALELCAAIGQTASVLFVDPSTAASLRRRPSGDCAGSRGLGGPRPSATSFGASLGVVRAELEQAMHAIEQVDSVRYCSARRGSVGGAAGSTPRQVVSLHTSGDAEVLTGGTGRQLPVTYSLWLPHRPGTGI